MAGSWKKFILDGDTPINVGTGDTTTGSIVVKGKTSGAVTLTVADEAGTYTLTLPTSDGDDGQQLTTDGSGNLSWAASGAGASAWDDIGDPDADTTIDVTGYETLITSNLNEAAHTVLTINDTVADITAAVTLLKLGFTDDGDADGTFFECLDNASGDSKFKIGVDGNTTIAGTLSAETITANTGFAPDANDGAYLGTSALSFSDLFLAEGGVINWDNGDLTLTQTGNVLAIDGGDFDFAQNKALSMVLETSTGAPDSGTEVEGQVYYELGDNHPYIWVA